jgi:hypothetical protein
MGASYGTTQRSELSGNGRPAKARKVAPADFLKVGQANGVSQARWRDFPKPLMHAPNGLAPRRREDP